MLLKHNMFIDFGIDSRSIFNDVVTLFQYLFGIDFHIDFSIDFGMEL